MEKGHGPRVIGPKLELPAEPELTFVLSCLSPRGEHLRGVTWHRLKQTLVHAVRDIQDHHTLQVAAALAYYFFLALFPSLIVFAELLTSIRTTDLFGWVLVTMGRLLPPETMQMVFSVLADVLSGHHRTLLSLGMVGLVWVASAAFDALIEALNIAYDVKDNRPLWKTRLLAVGLAVICGALFTCGLAVILVGPRFGDWLAASLDVPQLFATLWPFLHWTIAISFTVLAVELLFFLAPCEKPRFVDTLPGAIVTVGAWLGLSSLLGIYFRHFANYSVTYGTLGGFIAFMVWLQWTSFAMLVGAEINSELTKTRRARTEEKNLRTKTRVQKIPNQAA